MDMALIHHVQASREEHPAVAAAVHDLRHHDAAEFLRILRLPNHNARCVRFARRHTRNEIFFRNVIKIRRLGSFGQLSQSGKHGARSSDWAAYHRKRCVFGGSCLRARCRHQHGEHENNGDHRHRRSPLFNVSVLYILHGITQRRRHPC